MMKFMSRAMVTAAATSMAFAPIAAQANTRAGDGGPVYTSTAAQPGMARNAKGEDVRGKGCSIILILLASAAAIGGIVIAFSNGDCDQSPGT